MRVVFASANVGKIIEVKRVFDGGDFEIVSASEVGFDEDIEEDGLTLADNAIKKATVVSQATGLPTFADDTGLFIQALDGAPGVKARRWAGLNMNDEGIMNYVLEQMKNVPEGNRQAVFETVVAYVSPNEPVQTFVGQMTGHIALQPMCEIKEGMPYDPVFVADESKVCLGVMTREEKNAISHRGKAVLSLRNYLESAKK